MVCAMHCPVYMYNRVGMVNLLKIRTFFRVGMVNLLKIIPFFHFLFSKRTRLSKLEFTKKFITIGLAKSEDPD